MNEQANVNFIQEVLYNYKLPRYCRHDVTEKAWYEIASKVNMILGKIL